jgi:hypothetical protein
MKIISKHEAIFQGLSKYFTGSPCKHNHISERYVTGRSCVQCVTDKRNKSYLENVDKNKKQSRNWYLKNSTEHKNRSKLWQRANPEKVKSINRTWLIKNRDVANARTNYRRAYKLQRTPIWANQKEILKFYEDSIKISLETGIQHHVDHIVPLLGEFVSGLHVPNNLRVITAEENLTKSNTFISDWDSFE